LQVSGEELQALLVEMDLPELAITGLAVVQQIQNAPPIHPGAGRVITATFKHSSGDVIDLRVGDYSESDLSTLNSQSSNSDSIGTTSNHPFWSVDRQDYVQAGSLELGERLLTYSGDTKRVVSKLARPGPDPVYNLEVSAEHVYYVGKDGVLVHNSGLKYYNAANPARKIDSADFNRLTDDFSQNVTSTNFGAWKQGLLDLGYRRDTIMDVVEHGSIKKGSNIFGGGDGWGRYLEEITGTVSPKPSWHAHHQVQKGAGGASGAVNRTILSNVGIDYMFSRHNLGWAPLAATGLHGMAPQSQLLQRLTQSIGNRNDIIKVLAGWKVVSARRR
jgi:hypothetical protein